MLLENKKVIVATHIYATGPATDLRDYLIQHKAGELLYISHPLFFDTKLEGSGWELFKQGKSTSKIRKPHYKIPLPISYVKDVIFTVGWVLRTGKKWDLFVGSDNLNTLAGVFLKKIGCVNKLVYYVIDYNPKRFSNPILNWIYHVIDHIAVRNSDVTWNLSDRMRVGRIEYFKFHDDKQITLPIGIWTDRISKPDPKKSDNKTIVFVGHITKKQGLDEVIQAMPLILKSIPQAKLLIVGDGEYTSTLKQICKQLHIEKSVEFTGFIKEHKEIENIISRGAIAVAMYDKFVDGQLSFTYFADPGKLKLYLACGLPVVVSDVPHNARILEEKKCAIVVDNRYQSIADAVIRILKDKSLLYSYKQNARKIAEGYNWEKLFTQALNNILTK